MVAAVEGLPITGSFSSVAIMTTTEIFRRVITKKWIDAGMIVGTIDGHALHLEVVLTQVLHLATLRTFNQFSTAIMAFVSAVTHGGLGKMINTALAAVRDACEWDISEEDRMPGFDARRAAERAAKHRPTYPGGECDFRTKEQIREEIDGHASAAFKNAKDKEAWCRKKWPKLFAQAGGWDTQEKMRIGFGTLLAHWAGLRNSPVIKHLQRLFTLCVCSGFADMEFAKKNPLFWKRALADIKVEEFDAFDVVGEIFGTIHVVWNAVRDCVVMKSFTPLLGNTTAVREVELEMATLDSLVAYYAAGTLERITSEVDAYPRVIRDAEFVTRVDALAHRIQLLHKAEGHGATRVVLARYMQKIMGHQAQVREFTSRETMRMSPFTLKLESPTAQGKSVIQNQMMRDILKIGGFPHAEQNICFLDPSSKFWDSYTNQTTGVIIDDAQNTVVEFQKVDENSPIIKICNNAKTPVPKARVEDKGGVYIDCKVLIVSTNVADLNAHRLSNEPSAQLRRFPCTLR